MSRTLSLVALLLVPALAAADPAPFVWIEAEQPAAGSFASAPAGAARPDWLSGGKWLFVNVEAKDVAKQLPAAGAVFRYPFTAPASSFELWHRVGMEHVRSPFEWRINGGDWTTIKSKDPKFQTIDLMELSTWSEVAWLKMGDRELTKGDHTLKVRVPRPTRRRPSMSSPCRRRRRTASARPGRWKACGRSAGTTSRCPAR